jgi:hypothetical protein
MKFKIPRFFQNTQQEREPSREKHRSFPPPEPFDPNWLRYCPQRPLPPYRHLPGVTPHPVRDPRGHSYGREERDNEPVDLPYNWRQTEDYLYGVDLYNFAHWWEAHEAWEGLWNKTEDDCRLFLQGLIQISAALIKRHMRTLRAVRSLSIAGREKVRQTLHNLDDPRGIYMGIDLNEYLDSVNAFFDPFFSDPVSEETYSRVTVKPLIRLHFPDAT